LPYPDPEEQERDGAASRGHANDHARDDLDDTHAAFARIIDGLRADSAEPRIDDDHYDPPEPPPLPVPRPRTVGGVLILALGVLLLFGPNVLNLGERAAMLLGLLALTAGVGWLMIGLRPDPPPDGSDDGAQL